MELDSLRTEFGSSQIKAKRQLEECLQLAEEAIKEIRTLSYMLHPPMLEEMGLKLVIPWYLEDFKQRSGILATFEIEPDLGRLPDNVELAFFRVLQESLSNIHRHSGSQTAVVRLQIKDGLASLEISDLGKGTPPIALGESQQNTLQTQGVGIRGMSERMRQLGGDIQFTSTRQGTTVVARVPCEKSYISAATMA
jgi:signal transduction histidine kinase